MKTRAAIVGVMAGVATWAAIVLAIPAPKGMTLGHVVQVDTASLFLNVVAPLIVGVVTVCASGGKLRWYYGGLMGCQAYLWVLLIWLCGPTVAGAERVTAEGLGLMLGIGEAVVMGALGGWVGSAVCSGRRRWLGGDEFRHRIYGTLRFGAVTVAWLIAWSLVAGAVRRLMAGTRAPYVPVLAYSTSWLAMWFALGWSWGRLVRRADAGRWPLAFAGIAAVATLGPACLGLAGLIVSAMGSIVLFAISAILFAGASALAAHYGAILSKKKARVG